MDYEDTYSSVGDALQGHTLYDLYREIRREPALSTFEGQKLIRQIQGVTASPAFTPLDKVLSHGLGGGAGFAISKFFDMGPVGQALTTAIGVGVGKKLYDHFNKPPNPTPGWKILE